MLFWRTTLLRIIFALGALSTLMACNPVELWYKSGADKNKLNSDFVNCRVRATQSVPVNTQVRTTPTYVTPVQTNCYSTGYSVQCNTTGGQVHGGNTYSYDANSALRNDVVAQCMTQQGYQSVALPVCNKSQAKHAKVYKYLPQVSAKSCVTKASTGWLLVNPE